jgi:ADP-ribosyl-[dinitrogen reductase] hydrolase
MMRASLGGAVGDALGAPVEFKSYSQIVAEFGPAGIRDFAPAYGRVGAITDDTQMTLFTAEGLLRANTRFGARGVCHLPSVVHCAYLRWLKTQGVTVPSLEGGFDIGGWLIQSRLFERSALQAILLSPPYAIRNALGNRLRTTAKVAAE